MGEPFSAMPTTSGLRNMEKTQSLNPEAATRESGRTVTSILPLGSLAQKKGWSKEDRLSIRASSPKLRSRSADRPAAPRKLLQTRPPAPQRSPGGGGWWYLPDFCPKSVSASRWEGPRNGSNTYESCRAKAGPAGKRHPQTLTTRVKGV